jgi:hypothetical protein
MSSPPRLTGARSFPCISLYKKSILSRGVICTSNKCDSLFQSSKYGCCDDDLTAAGGPNKEGCPEIVNCELSKYGCCPDGFTATGGKRPNGEKEGCPEETELPCALMEFGCCSDGETAATGKRCREQ